MHFSSYFKIYRHEMFSTLYLLLDVRRIGLKWWIANIHGESFDRPFVYQRVWMTWLKKSIEMLGQLLVSAQMHRPRWNCTRDKEVNLERFCLSEEYLTIIPRSSLANVTNLARFLVRILAINFAKIRTFMLLLYTAHPLLHLLNTTSYICTIAKITGIPFQLIFHNSSFIIF